MASEKITQILEEVKALTILELADTYLEKKLKKKGINSVKTEETEEPGGLISRFKRKALRLQENAADGGRGDLTRLERLQLGTYELAVKHHIFSETTDDALTRFAAERTALLNAAEVAEKVSIPQTVLLEKLPAEEDESNHTDSVETDEA